MRENKEYEITKSSRRDWIGVTFQCHIINKGVNVAPKWFRDWAEAFEKKNDAMWAENDARWTKQEEFNKYVGDFVKHQTEFNNRVNDFMEQQVAFNNQQTEFNKYVLNVFKRNNLE